MPEASQTAALDATTDRAPGLPGARSKPLAFVARHRATLLWVLLLMVAAAGAYAYYRYSQAHRPPDVQYKTAALEQRKIVGRITASGTLQAVVTVQVGSQVSGRLQHINVDFNSTVKKGELIATIDPLLFQAAVAQAHANYSSAAAGVVQAQATLRNADRVYARTKALNEQSLASQADLETAETSLAVAKAGVDVAKASFEQARASLNQAEVNLSFTNIYSPIDGTVISRNVDVGQTVAASLQAPVLFTIAEDLRKMQVNTNIAEGDVGRLREGMDAYFTVDAFPGQVFRGKISQIRNAAQTLQNVVTYDAVVDVDNSDLRLRPGMTANATIVYDTREQALAVSNAALRFKPPPSIAGSAAPSATGSARKGSSGSAPGVDPASDKRTVWVLRGSTPTSVAIHIGLSDGSVTEVKDGDLAAGDLAITDVTGTTTASTAAASPPGGTRRPF